jgi:serine/threonine-protein kinase
MSDRIPTTAEEAAVRLLDLDLVEPAQMDRVGGELGGRTVPLETLLAALLRRELLTRYQVERMLRGERHGFFYGRSKVLYQVGAGSFARVFRAVDRDTGAIHAVKVLRNRYSSDAARCAAFQREGAMGRMLDHPHIVRIENVGQEHGFSFIAMEFVEGQNLRELIRLRGALDVPRGLELVGQLASALEYAHGKGVTHRDLKASNVLVSLSGDAKLVDFGLAGIAGATDRNAGVEQPRTIDYATLEKVTGTRNDSVRCDIYFLGTLAYLVFSGMSALKESRDRAVRGDPQRFLSAVPLGDAAPRLPRPVINIVSQMMQLDPTQRFQTATEVRRAIDVLASQLGDDNQAASSPAPAAKVPAAPEASPRETPETPQPKGPAAAQGAAPPAARVGAGSQRPPTLMLVEKPRKAQESLRRFMQNLGYRVLLTENPKRALARLSIRPLPADCLVISAQELGLNAVEAFNQLSGEAFLSDVPAILIASPKQEAVVEAAHFDDLRRLLQIPIDADEMISLLATLVAVAPSRAAAAS